MKKDKEKVRASFEINSRWTLFSDELSVSLQEKRFSEKKKEVVPGRMYHYPNFEIALKSMIDKEVQISGTFERIVGRIVELKKEVKELFSEVDQWRNSIVYEDKDKIEKRMSKLNSTGKSSKKRLKLMRREKDE